MKKPVVEAYFALGTGWSHFPSSAVQSLVFLMSGQNQVASSYSLFLALILQCEFHSGLGFVMEEGEWAGMSLPGSRWTQRGVASNLRVICDSTGAA